MKHTPENLSRVDHRSAMGRVSTAWIRRFAMLCDASGDVIAPPGYGVRLT